LAAGGRQYDVMLPAALTFSNSISDLGVASAWTIYVSKTLNKHETRETVFLDM
jgi:hypothetical protein